METNNKIIKLLSYLVGLLVLLTVGFAWSHSAVSISTSQAESGRWLDMLGPILSIFLPDEWVTDFFVRKLAHFSEYGALGVELAAFVRLRLKLKSDDGYRPGKAALFINTVITGLLVAFIDETIQIFSGRGPLVSDMWIDFGGCFLGAGLVWVIWNLVEARRRRKHVD